MKSFYYYIFLFFFLFSFCLFGREKSTQFITIIPNETEEECSTPMDIVLYKNDNEFYEVYGIEEEIYTIELEIYNRFGDKIYYSNNYKNNWKGSSFNSLIGNSQKAPSGTYFYTINIKGTDIKPSTGAIYLAF